MVDRAGVGGRGAGGHALPEMTEAALKVLEGSEDGFFLMIEGASIDKMEHSLDGPRAVYDTIELDQAIGVPRRWAAKHDDTLIVVTADHNHSMSIVGTHDRRGATGRAGNGVYAETLHFVDLVFNPDNDRRPGVPISDQVSYSDIVFGIVTLLGFDHRPVLADLPDAKLGRVNRSDAALNAPRPRSPTTIRNASCAAATSPFGCNVQFSRRLERLLPQTLGVATFRVSTEPGAVHPSVRACGRRMRRSQICQPHRCFM